MEARVGAEAFEQRAQRFGELDPGRYVRADVGAKARRGRRVVVATNPAVLKT